MKEPVEINIKKIMAGEDPAVPIFHVEVIGPHGLWRESWGSEEHLRIFLRGIEAAGGILGTFIFPPYIPR